MPRPPRIDFPDAVYHVTSRGNGRAGIFWSDDDRQRFLAQLAHHLHRADVVLYAYVLMTNHCRWASRRACRGGAAEEPAGGEPAGTGLPGAGKENSSVPKPGLSA